ncbi:MAG: hypothetical protein ACYC27_20900 [Armatimonadota bacterium]
MRLPVLFSIIGTLALLSASVAPSQASEYKGKYCTGKGDIEYLQMIDRSFGCFHPNPNAQNISMVYFPVWDTFVLGPQWLLWWTQNSYGTTYCSLPFLQEPWLKILQNSQDMWYNRQGDGKRTDYRLNIGPDGCLCDAASPDTTFYIQGDLDETCPSIGDWIFEGTMAGTIMQAELLLINRDMKAIKSYLPKMERSCDMVERRRDPKNNLILVGPGADLLCPSYGGVKRANGSVEKAYLTGIVISYTAALDKLVELEKLTGNQEKAELYASRAKLNREALKQLTAPEGYLIKYMAQDGTKHGLYGQETFGYFDSVCNVDAICHRVVDDAQGKKIYDRIATIPQLRQNGFLINNYPGLDDMYLHYGQKDNLPGIYEFGRWVNGGAWLTVEGRAIMAYYRLGKYEDVRRSMQQFMKFSQIFQLDAPFTDFGKNLWFPDKLTNLCHDDFAVPAAVVRGLFEYGYSADSLTLRPHIPPSILEYTQHEPIRFGTKSILVSVKNGGPRIKSVMINGDDWRVDASDRVALSYNELPKQANVEIVMEGGWSDGSVTTSSPGYGLAPDPDAKLIDLPADLAKAQRVLTSMQSRMKGIRGSEYADAFTKEALCAIEAYRTRASRDAAGAYSEFSREKREAILTDYRNAANNMYTGFMNLMKRYESGSDKRLKRLAAIYNEGF